MVQRDGRGARGEQLLVGAPLLSATPNPTSVQGRGSTVSGAGSVLTEVLWLAAGFYRLHHEAGREPCTARIRSPGCWRGPLSTNPHGVTARSKGQLAPKFRI